MFALNHDPGILREITAGHEGFLERIRTCPSRFFLLLFRDCRSKYMP